MSCRLVLVSLMSVVIACGKGDERAGSASGSATAPPPSVIVDAVPAPSQSARAKAALDDAASVLTALTTAIGSDRCGSAERVHAAIVANADKIAQVKAALGDPAVAEEAQKIARDTEPFHTALNSWGTTQIDGTCKVKEDIDVVNDMMHIQ